MSTAIMFAPLIIFVVLLGWLVPLIFGIARVQNKTGGRVLLSIGILWGLVAIGAAGFSAYWICKAASQSSRTETTDFDPSTYTGAVGTISCSWTGKCSLVMSEQDGSGQRIRVHLANGAGKAPAGRFTLSSCDLTATDDRGTEWTARGYFYSPQAPDIVVRAGSNQEIKIGPPFRISVKVQSDEDNNASLSLSVIGQDNREYSILDAGAYPVPPSFEVASKSAQILWQGKFEFG